MGCTIGGIVLDHTPLWVDMNRYHDSITETAIAIDGTEIVLTHTRGRHFPITLESIRETGWLKGSTVDALRTLSKVVGAYYTLVLNGMYYTVRFCNEEIGGAIQMETLTIHSNPDDNTWWIGTIYLMCVG
jgi:hypothetical protein